MEVERLPLRNTTVLRVHVAFVAAHRLAEPQVSIYLVSRGEQEERLAAGPASCVKNIERPGKVYFKVKPGIHQGCSDRHLRGKMVDFVSICYRSFHHPAVTY